MEQAQLPDLSHFSFRDRAYVYEPADDTFLLCDGILNDKEDLIERDPHLVVELGSGSGCVIVFTTMLLNSLKGAEAHHQSIALDINPKALEMTKATAEANHVRLYSIIIGC